MMTSALAGIAMVTAGSLHSNPGLYISGWSILGIDLIYAICKGYPTQTNDLADRQRPRSYYQNYTAPEHPDNDEDSLVINDP